MLKIRTHLSLGLLLGTWPFAMAQTPTPGAEYKPYDQIIPSSARTTAGLFKVHQVGDKLYYEIPPAQLDKDMLMVVQVARGKLGTGDGGGEPVDERVVRWQRRDKKVLLLDIDYSIWADPKLPIARAVAAANQPTILQSFTVEGLGPQDSPVIDVSKLYSTEIVEFSPKRLLGAKAFDKDRSYLESCRAFPENIEVESVLTLTNPDASRRGGSASVRMRYSMVRLPDTPMKPRLRDSRVGYFATRQTDYGRPDHFVNQRAYLARWRLEKKDPTAALSEPIKPIIFYIDPATPAAWVPYVKRGVEQWQAAFEEAGFKKAILALEAPTDPNWSMEDARYSVIRWLASSTPNAYGPHTSDPRSGEILEADIHMFHNILDLQRRWYFTQVGHLDPRVKSLPMPDDLMGQLIEFVVAHEVGHSLGLPHNMRGSSTYSLAQVRDRDWVKKMGHTPSIMDYSRFNYVAQPEDKIDTADLIPRVGPYDRFSISWGYKPIPEARTPDQELPTLDQWARQQDHTPWLRFSSLDSHGVDPGDQTESVGDADPVGATRLGLKNLRRVNSMLLSATGQYGQPYDELAHFRRQLLAQWGTELRHVLPLIGGVTKQEKHYGQSGSIYCPIPRERQREAVEFLVKEALVSQDWLLSPELIRLTHLEGALIEVSNVQQRLLYNMADPWRLNRMAEQKALDPAHAYAPDELLGTLRRELFRDLLAGGAVPLARRNLQRTFADLVVDLSYTWGEARNHGQHQLRILLAELLKAQKRSRDVDTLAHLEQMIDDLKREIDPRSTGRKDEPIGTRWTDPSQISPPDCWDDGGMDWLKPLPRR